MKISKGGLEIYPKIHEIYETFKLENFIPHLYVYLQLLVVMETSSAVGTLVLAAVSKHVSVQVMAGSEVFCTLIA